MTLALVWGTRPESIKLGVVAAELRLRGVPFVSIATGQHASLLEGTPAESDLAGSVSLELAADGSVWRWVWIATKRLMQEYRARGITAVAVQGDTMSALAGARAASYLGLELFHIEAGVRSGNDKEPWPEERIRVDIATMASWHYAPTETARLNLLGEGIAADRILVTGNPGVSALARYAPGATAAATPGSHILITMHRREAKAIGAIRDAAGAALAWAMAHPEADLIWPAHPGSGVPLLRTENVHVIGPLAYRDLIAMLTRSIGVATDSGGIQEEAATLGVPCAVLRNVTDRPESVAEGVAALFSPGGTGMTQALDAVWTRQIARTPVNCYGTARAASNIAAHLALQTSNMGLPAHGICVSA
jgi:UDP-N-acetylglucosamine 2-epimerase (non-hydrolysing)